MMYAYLDQPVASLHAARRTLLSAMRGWALARTMARDPRSALSAMLPDLDSTGALDMIDAAMQALDGGTDEAIAFQRPCHAAVEEIEAILLAVTDQAASGRIAEAAATLALIVDPDSADRIAVLLADADRRAASVLAHPWR